MICYKHDPLGEGGFNSAIRGSLDLILDALITTDNDRSRCKPDYQFPAVFRRYHCVIVVTVIPKLFFVLAMYLLSAYLVNEMYA